jgi:hypothetical protein
MRADVVAREFVPSDNLDILTGHYLCLIHKPNTLLNRISPIAYPVWLM